MTQSFDEWKKEQERIHNDYDAENAWNAGAQSKQAEIDELRKRIENLESALNKINENLDLHDCESCWQHYFEIEKVLPDTQKGTTNEQ